MHSGLMVTNLVKAPHLWPTSECAMESLLCLLSDIHSLSENKRSAKGVYSVFVALQENPSLQKLEWVQPFLCFLLVNIFLLNFICCCILAWMVVWIPDSIRITVLIRWLCTFLTHYHGSNKSSSFWTNNCMCISNRMCLTTRNHGLSILTHTVV